LIVELSEQAIAEVESAVAFVRRDNPHAAKRLQAAIERAVESLSDTPMRGRQGRIDGTRELLVRGTPYVVIYAVEDAVRVASVRHTRQGRPP
jgi:toxin ParE1/3/4